MKVTLTGGTGLIGQALAIRLLKSFAEVKVLVRTPEKVNFLPADHVYRWSSKDPLPEEAIRGIDALVHLAGEPVAGSRWSDAQKKEILNSRIESTERVIDSIRKLSPADRPKVLISASAIGIYGEHGQDSVDESSEVGAGFLAEVTALWEIKAKEVEALGVRLVLLRTGIVLSREGGALAKMMPVVLGSGKQWMSWIHIDDEVGIIEHAIQNSEMKGAYNLVAPQPVTNQIFSEVLGEIIHFPFVAKAPEFALKLALGQMSDVILASQKVVSTKLPDSGYVFKFSELKSALQDLYPNGSYLNSHFSSAQFIPKSIEEVFPFFSRAENLEEITPPWLHFKIVGKSTPEMSDQTKIDYQLKLYGVPFRWQSRIEKWEPGVRFVDYQTKGPYSKWYHEHQFYPVTGGTLMVDQVTYRVPGWAIGKAVLGAWINHDVQKIFNHRRGVIAKLFGKAH